MDTGHPFWPITTSGNDRYERPRADGRVYSAARDPPGQSCAYISSGHHLCEAYRLSTFEHFTSTFVNPETLAKHGFIFTGFKDRVKCFSCGLNVENWQTGDNEADDRWHKTDCLFKQGLPTGNVPIGRSFTQSATNSYLNSNTWQPTRGSQSYISEIRTDRIPRIPTKNTYSVFPTEVPGTASTFQIQPGSSAVIGSSQNLEDRRWVTSDVISADHKRHLTNLYLNRELDRLASFGRWPTGRPNVSPAALARAGFFYLGDMDRTQCFSCGCVRRKWSTCMNEIEHSIHFPNCRFVLGTERQNVPIPDRPETSRELAVKFPCRFPINPHMRSEASRVKTFDIRWSNNRFQAKPHEIAEAGFFLDGRNQVKCWYCNGGLQHWECDDVPWIEHAKWFPNCQYLLSIKGQHFVYRHLAMNPQLPRPIIARQDGFLLDPGTEMRSVHQQRPGDISPSQRNVRQPSPPPTILDPQELDMRQVRVDNEMQNSEIVKLVLLMGYSADTIRYVMLEKLESGAPFDAENIFESTASLLDAVMKMEERKSEMQQTQATNIKLPSVSGSEDLKRKILAMFGDVKYPQKKAMLKLGLSKLGNLAQTRQEAIDDLLLRASNFLNMPLADGGGLSGDDLFQMIIRSIPSDKWMRFARYELSLTEPEIRKIKETCEPTDEQLIQLEHLIKERDGSQ